MVLGVQGSGRWQSRRMRAFHEARWAELVAGFKGKVFLKRGPLKSRPTARNFKEGYSLSAGTKLSRAQIIESVDSSLKRLGTDYIDLLQIHWPERHVGLTGGMQTLRPMTRARGETPILEQCEALAELVDSGKIRHWGLSNENSYGKRSAMLCKAARSIGLAPPACMQNAYSLLQRRDEIYLVPDLLEDPKEPPTSYIPYSPLAAGVLTGKYMSTSKDSGPSRLKQFPSYAESFLVTNGPAAVEAYARVAKRHGLTPAQLALAHCNSRDFVTSTVIGATSRQQLTENLSAFQVEWTQELEDDVRDVYAQHPDPWRVLLSWTEEIPSTLYDVGRLHHTRKSGTVLLEGSAVSCEPELLAGIWSSDIFSPIKSNVSRDCSASSTLVVGSTHDALSGPPLGKEKLEEAMLCCLELLGSSGCCWAGMAIWGYQPDNTFSGSSERGPASP
ncbi:MAG: hypothetical protein SGPRY_007664 [Prymnesium sp.]